MDGGHGHVTPRPDGAKARCGGPGICAQCSQEAATAAFQAVAGKPATGVPGEVACPHCGHLFVPAAAPVRATD